MSVICLVTVVVQLGNVYFSGTERMEGRVLAVGKQDYVIDFSMHARHNNYVGDYSKVLVNKQKCAEVPK